MDSNVPMPIHSLMFMPEANHVEQLMKDQAQLAGTLHGLIGFQIDHIQGTRQSANRGGIATEKPKRN